MEFKSKNILIISPQPWGKMAISKHHYATVLANTGNNVFFLNPPLKDNSGISLSPVEGHERLLQINYSLFFPYRIKFHFRWLFDKLMRLQVRRILKEINIPLDVVWCFEPNLFSDLKQFGAQVKIFHPVDYLQTKEQIKTASSADIIFSVSQSILDNFTRISTPRFIVNHGLADDFAAYAGVNSKTAKYREKQPLKIGYVGNLTRPLINRKLLSELIEQYPSHEFHFWGPYEQENSNNLGNYDDNDTRMFIEMLKVKTNVVLHGSVGPKKLAGDIQLMDVFLVLYVKENGVYDCSNSHKILEYLSTGKTVVSNVITFYENLRDLMEMPVQHSTNEDEEIKKIFAKVLMQINDYNADLQQQKRKKFALNNSYLNQVSKIEKLINDNR